MSRESLRRFFTAGGCCAQRGSACANVNTGDPVNPQTVFHLASVSKSLSATVVARIVGRKQIQWIDPILGHLPDFKYLKAFEAL